MHPSPDVLALLALGEEAGTAGQTDVARAGVEPATFRFSGERCYQLSYLAN